MTDAGVPTPSGWYPDPGGTTRLRYWDGSRWTDQYAAPSAAPTMPLPPSPMASAPYQAPPVGPPPYQPGPVYPQGYPPRQSGMSGCLKAFLIVFAVAAIGGVALVVGLVVVGGRVVHNFTTTVAGTPGRPASLASTAADYTGERKQDHVAGADGVVTIGSLSATATGWSRTTADGAALVCGNVTIRRGEVTSKDPFDAALQLAGDFAWELDTPSRAQVADDANTSALSALSDYLTNGQTGSATGRICFADPGGSGQFAVTWQPRLFRAERAVWIFKL